MQVHVRGLICGIIICVMLSACGELRFSRVSPGIGEFHPEAICILPVDAGVYAQEAGGRADDLIFDIVKRKGWFSTIVSPKEVTELAERDDLLKDTIADYRAKLQVVHFSDPDLSRFIGKACNADAFLIVNVDFWNYTVQGDDKLAKAGFNMNLVAAQTGEIMGKANHFDTEKYKWFKPDLTAFARDVAAEMISQMPH